MNFKMWQNAEDAILQGPLNHLFGGIKQCKCMVILRHFPYDSALFGLVI